ncbi:Hypothetical protein Tpal_2294 [Trichococcus palustris]|uniref:Uncharacterized protein n=1 Tax=Trichococcus palustris TaxID=140314 RepID=A0A143YTQ4_9LACT|nr:Hypothetical protein Tpal_2294 [Trichococcus palustris]SFK94297.1 hypothetical protein SAMN04488076_11025 [Trichococcus palustris]
MTYNVQSLRMENESNDFLFGIRCNKNVGPKYKKEVALNQFP